MDRKQQALRAVELLEREYPDALCSLDYVKPHELLISTRLAAQCTDARVNMVTPALYAKYPTIEAFAEADPEDVAEIIRSCGFYKIKSKDIVACCQMLRDRFGGEVPQTMEELLELPGVGRKTANLVLGDAFGKPAVVCDTHCIRITNLLGLSTGKDPYKVEMQLREILPMDRANDFCHRLVLHGRAVCIARRPQCSACCLREICDYAAGREETA